MVGRERTCHLSVEQRFKVISECVQQLLLVLSAHGRSGLLGFGKDKKHQEFSIKPFQFLREKMKKAEFLGLAAKGEADAEQRKGGDLGEAVCESRKVTKTPESVRAGGVPSIREHWEEAGSPLALESA